MDIELTELPLIESKKELDHDALDASKQDGIISFEHKCENIADALNFIKSPKIDKHLNESDDVFLIKFEINEIFSEPNEIELGDLSEICMKNAVVLYFSSRCGKHFLIYWKSKEQNFFIKFKTLLQRLQEDAKELYKMILNMILDCLKIGHLGLHPNYPKIESTTNIEIFQLADHRGYNLLLLASEAGNVNITVKLYKLGFDLTDYEKKINAQELALLNKQYDVVFRLYKENVILPTSINMRGCPDEFSKFIKLLNEFNKMIKIDDLKKVKEIFRKLPKTNYFYNTENESALKVAITNKSFDSYKFFVSEKLLFGPHEAHEEYFEKLSKFQKLIVTEIHNEFTQELQEKHINVLLSKSFLSHDVPDAKEKLKYLHQAYETLNTNEFIKVILKIVAASKNFKIIFDFNRESVNIANPTEDKHTEGIFYPSGRIYIGAKNLLNEATAPKTLGVIAHELCHFAVNLVYGNSAKPYKKDDLEAMEKFNKISENCKKNKSKENVIKLVYGYDDDMHHAELIVRVVHLLALYNNQPEKMAEIRETFGELFEFFEKKIFKDMENALEGIKKKIEEEEAKKDKKINRLKRISMRVRIVSIITIIIGFFITRAIFYKPFYNFHELSWEDQMRVENGFVNYKNNQIHLYDLFPRNSSVYGKLASEHIAQIFSNESLNLNDPYFRYLDELIVFNWGNLTEKLKIKFLNSKFSFQNESLKFEGMYEKVPEAFDSLTSKQIIEVLSGHELKIDKMISNQTKPYVERSFIYDDIFAIYYAYRVSIDSLYSNNPYDMKIKAELGLSEENFLKFYTQFMSQNSSIIDRKIDEIRHDEVFILKKKKEFNWFFGPLMTFRSVQVQFNEIFKATEESKFFIIYGLAGSKKTTTFKHFTMRIKKIFPMRWVSFISLRKNTEFFNLNENLNLDMKIKNAKNLLKRIFGLNSENNFEMKIFEGLFEAGEVVLLWDAFDEMDSKYFEYILNAIDLIFKNTKNMQFMCVRPFFTKILWNKFNIVPYVLVPFDENEQKEFLTKYFISLNIAEEKIHIYIEKVLKIVSEVSAQANNVRTHQDTNTALMLQIFADIISSSTKIFHSGNLYRIYEKFIDKQFENWRRKSSFASSFIESAMRKYSSFDMMRMYQMYALKSELSNFNPQVKMTIKKLKIMHQSIPKKLTYDEISRMGILYIRDENDFKFAHKTVAQFLVSTFFVEHIYNAKYDENEDPFLVLQLFFDVSKEYGNHQVVITNFLNSFLQTSTANKTKSFDINVANVLRKKFKTEFFEHFFQNNQETMKFLFNFFKKDHKLLIDLLNVNECETLYTATFNHAYFNGQTFNSSLLKELGRNHLTDKAFDMFIHGKNQKGIILYSLYIYHRQDAVQGKNTSVIHGEYSLDDEILKNEDQVSVLVSITKNLTTNELRELFVSKTSPITYEKNSFIEDKRFWDVVDKSLSLPDQKILISNLFYGISKPGYYQNSLPYLISKAKQKLSNSDIFEIFINKNILQITAAYSYNNEMFTFLWTYFVKHTSEKEQKEILTHEVDGECLNNKLSLPNQKCYEFQAVNVFQIALTQLPPDKDNCMHKFNYFKGIYEKYFSKSEIQEIFLKSNELLPYLVLYNNCLENISIYLRELFEENENVLVNFILENIQSTNFNIFELFKDIHDEKSTKNLELLIELLNKLRDH